MVRRKKSIERGGMHKMPCTGCGRHAKLVDDKVTAWFCNNCFTGNGNYLRYLKGQEMIKPVENIHVKDKVRGVDGKVYVITGRADTFRDDKYYYCKEDGKKMDSIVLGDWFFVEKV